MKSKKLTRVMAIILAVLLLLGIMVPVLTVFAKPETAVVTAIKYYKQGTTEEIVTIDANTAFDVVISLYDADGDIPTNVADISASLATTAFTLPSVSNITVDNLTTNTYDIKFSQLKYLGGGNPSLSFNLSYANTATPVPMATITSLLSICKEPVVAPSVEPTPEPTVTPVKAPTLAPKAISVSAKEVNPNVAFSVTANTFNTSNDQTVENVTATITTDTQLKLASGSNTIYIGNIAPGAATQATFNILAANTAEQGSYNATVTFSGVWDGTAVTTSQEIAVNVVQPERFEISRTEVQEIVYLGEEASLTVYYVNKGKGEISNLSAEIKGVNMLNQGQQQFIGNVMPGTENSIDFYINPEAAGAVELQVVLTYEDVNGNIKTLEEEIFLTAEDNMGGGDLIGPMGPFDPMGPEGEFDPTISENSGFPIWAWILIAVVVVAIIVTVIIVVKKVKAKRQLALDMEDDDDEDI